MIGNERSRITIKNGSLEAIQRTQRGPDFKLCTKYLRPYKVKRILRNDTWKK